MIPDLHGRPSILVVDDDETLLRADARILTRGGYQVETAADGVAAMEALGRRTFDTILCDISMPGVNGIELIDRIRERDLDVPVVIVTGHPSPDTAIEAMDRGALRYLIKPVDIYELLKVVGDAVRLNQIARAKRQVIDLSGGDGRFSGDQSGLATRFARCLDSLYVAYQPVVSVSKRTVFAYEALVRSREPSLPHPGALFDAAERLGRVHELGRVIRARTIEPLSQLPDDVSLFMNIHPGDLLDESLFDPATPLARVARRITLEITERASLHGIADIRERVAALRKLGFGIAIDDLGAGYAGLTSFSLLEPDIVKLDMALIRGLHREPMKQTLVRTMIAMCRELGIVVTGEGIEVREEGGELARSGCDLMQGYLFAHPGPPFPAPAFG